MDKNREAKSSLKYAVVELHNIALYFHGCRNLGIAAATYVDAANAVQALTSDSVASERGLDGIEAVKTWHKTLRQRLRLQRIFSDNQISLSVDLLEEINLFLDERIEPISLPLSTSCSNETARAVIYHNMGLVRFQLQQMDLAVECLRMASSSLQSTQDCLYARTFLSVHYLLGIVHAYQGRPQDSMKEFCTALHLQGDDLLTEDLKCIRIAIIEQLHATLISIEHSTSANTLIASVKVLHGEESELGVNAASPAA